MDKLTLARYKWLRKLIEIREEEKKQIINSIGASRQLDGMPHGTSISNPTENIGIKWAELQTQIDKDLDECIELRIEIEEAIKDLPEVDQVLILLHYIEGKTWDEVACEMHYGLRHIHKLHGAILQKMALNGTVID